MPTMHKRKLSEVPKPSRVSRAIREKQELYEDFIKAAGAEVGELELDSDEAVRAVKVRIRRAVPDWALTLRYGIATARCTSVVRSAVGDLVRQMGRQSSKSAPVRAGS